MLLQELTAPQVQSLSRDIPVIIPIAAVEQHGTHLPLFTDSMLLGEVVRRVEAQLSQQILVTPLMWLGSSHHHMDFAGTLSCAPRLYLDLLAGLLDNLIAHGFRRLVLLNGHGGNDIPGKQVVFEVRQRYRDRQDLLLLLATYWALGSEPWQGMPEIEQREMGHACEWETSMVLRLAPHLVGDYRAAAEVPQGNPFLPATRGWTMPDRSVPGHVGAPRSASAEKGEHLLATFSADVQKWLQRVIDWDGISWEG